MQYKKVYIYVPIYSNNANTILSSAFSNNKTSSKATNTNKGKGIMVSEPPVTRNSPRAKGKDIIISESIYTPNEAINWAKRAVHFDS